MKRGRPPLTEKNKPVAIYIPEKLIIIADKMGIKYKELLREQFEKMMCVAILSQQGIDGCNICESIIERKRIIDEAYQKALELYTEKKRIEESTHAKMKTAIRVAIKEGKPRGEAESDFGQIFPDELWIEGARNVKHTTRR